MKKLVIICLFLIGCASFTPKFHGEYNSNNKNNINNGSNKIGMTLEGKLLNYDTKISGDAQHDFKQYKIDNYYTQIEIYFW